ncbi:hypothetical protein JCM10213v2_007505 [Rhodosporidiobolus nylandii]
MVSVTEISSFDRATHAQQLQRVHKAIEQRAQGLADLPVASAKDAVEACLTALPEEVPRSGLGLKATTDHLLNDVAPALMPGQAGPRCYGLVIGGVTPAAQLADELVTSFDPCVQVHWAEATASVALENLALSYLLSLLSLPADVFSQNTFTTGATASNVVRQVLLTAHRYVAEEALAEGIVDEVVKEGGSHPPSKGGAAENYSGPRTEQALLDFLNEKCGTHKLPGGLLGDLAGRIPSLDTLASLYLAPTATRPALP